MTSAILLVLAVCPSVVLAWSLVAQPVEGFLVLRNGNILRGRVQQQGEHYHVYMPNGKLQVREQQVEMFCQNLDEAYQRRRESRAGSSADSHLDLAAWCLRHDLLDYAHSELQAASLIDPHHDRLALLQRQLKSVIRMAELHKQQQLAEQIVAPEPEPLDPASLEKAPPWARALFVRQIQPIMVHSCAAGGCHQAGTASEFQLNRLAIDGAGHPDATLRNLAATLKQIDWEAADESDLLKQAQRAHGSGSSSKPMPMHKLQVLQGWIAQLTEAHHKRLTLMTLPLLAEDEPNPPPLQLNAPQQSVAQP
ncbi:MAG: hypothetical protein ACR2NM_16295, partial [Bythopirellula sp.]